MRYEFKPLTPQMASVITIGNSNCIIFQEVKR